MMPGQAMIKTIAMYNASDTVGGKYIRFKIIPQKTLAFGVFYTDFK
jgi:hypothetical protein